MQTHQVAGNNRQFHQEHYWPFSRFLHSPPAPALTVPPRRRAVAASGSRLPPSGPQSRSPHANPIREENLSFRENDQMQVPLVQHLLPLSIPPQPVGIEDAI